MKREYQFPTIKVLNLLIAGSFADGVASIEGNTDLNYGGGSDEPARAKEYDATDGSVWADEMWNPSGWTDEDSE